MPPTFHVLKPRLTRQLVVPMSQAMMQDLRAEAHANGYRSLAAFVRDYKLGYAGSGIRWGGPRSYTSSAT